MYVSLHPVPSLLPPGRCDCYSGYVGEDCSLQATAAPSTVELPDRGLCDMHTRDCSTCDVYVDNVVDTPHLACLVQEVQVWAGTGQGGI